MNSRRVMLAPLMTEHRTGKNYRAGRGNVRFGSLADMCVAKRHVRFTPIADIGSAQVHVRFVPIADIALFDHLVRMHTERIWDFEPECFGGFSVDE